MPELPEVQTVVSTLEHLIKGECIDSIDVHYPSIIEGDVETFIKRLKGQHFVSFLRRGKYLLFEMDDLTLVSHLRMEGKYYVKMEEETIDKHTHVVFRFKSGKKLCYHDTRKFGRMEIIEKREDYRVFKDLGPEPFSEEFNLSYCKKYLKDLNRPMKAILLEQSFVAGIGNIYADEILYMIHTHPTTKGKWLSDSTIEAMIVATREVLAAAIQKGGTTIRSYTSSLGVTGLFQLSLRVHDRAGGVCERCGSTIEKMVVATRGTYYCPHCQIKTKYIALTGTIGSGKSTVADIIREKGYEVFDADLEVAKLLKKGEAGFLKVQEAFPSLFENNELIKERMADLIFQSKEAKKEIEGILHPLVLDAMKEQSKGKRYFFAEIPLLFEVKWEHYFDEVLVVASSKKNALERLKGRGISTKEANRRMVNQMKTKEKIERASFVIYNSGTRELLKENVDLWLEGVVC